MVRLHLQEIPEVAGLPAFWVNSAACIDTALNSITHKLAHGELKVRHRVVVCSDVSAIDAMLACCLCLRLYRFTYAVADRHFVSCGRVAYI